MQQRDGVEELERWLEESWPWQGEAAPVAKGKPTQPPLARGGGPGGEHGPPWSSPRSPERDLTGRSARRKAAVRLSRSSCELRGRTPAWPLPDW